jgi:2-polyprenyl-3-methyl-5-hydroxy-6-metoxy-1,4-benzoquinol methylase
MSVDFYDQNASTFFAQTAYADMSDGRRRFLSHVPDGGTILDAGCGSGRDAKAFLERGYGVEAFDASAEMVRLASDFTGLSVRHMTFDQMSWSERFDGIWASASLLHVPRVELPGIAQRFQRALKLGGVWYVSFKHGTDEREKDGRRFTDMTESLLQKDLLASTTLEVLDVWVSQDVRPGRADELWLSAILRR